MSPSHLKNNQTRNQTIKLASMQHSGPRGGPIQTVDLTKLSDDDLARLEDIFGPLAGPGDDDAPDQGGEGEAGTGG
jgi:hypothetical protein